MHDPKFIVSKLEEANLTFVHYNRLNVGLSDVRRGDQERTGSFADGCQVVGL